MLDSETCRGLADCLLHGAGIRPPAVARQVSLGAVPHEGRGDTDAQPIDLVGSQGEPVAEAVGHNLLAIGPALLHQVQPGLFGP